MEQMAFDHRTFVVSLMNIDQHHDSKDVPITMHLQVNTAPPARPGEARKSIQRPKFSF